MARRFRPISLLLLLLVLLAAGYLLRWPLLGGLIREQASKALESALGVTVELDGLDGPLFSGIECRSLRAEAMNDRSRVRLLSLDHIEVRYNPFDLIVGGLDAFSISARNAAIAVDLDRPGTGDAASTDGGDGLALPASLPSLDVTFDRIVASKGTNMVSALMGKITVDSPDDTGKQTGDFKLGDVVIFTPDREELWRDVEASLSVESGMVSIEFEEFAADGDRIHASLDLLGEPMSRALLSIDAAQAVGTIRVEAEARLEEPAVLEATIDAVGLDLARTAAALEPVAGCGLPLFGSLSGTLSVAGPLENTAALSAELDCRIDEGGWSDIAPVDLTLSAQSRDAMVNVENCIVDGDGVGLTLSGGSMPMQEWIPDLESASAAFAFHLSESPALDRILELLGLEPVGALSGGQASGEGRLDEGVLRIASARLGNRSASVRLEEASLELKGGGVHISVAALDGDLEGSPFGLTEPLVIDIRDGRVEVAPTRFHAGSGSVQVDAEFFDDRTARIRAVLADTDPSLLDMALPAGEYGRRFDWDGMRAVLELSGHLDALSGNLAVDMDRLSYEQLALETVILRARLDPDRVTVEHLECALAEGGNLAATGGWSCDARGLLAAPERLEASVDWRGLNLAVLQHLLPEASGAAGETDGSIEWSGSLAEPRIALEARFMVNRTPEALVARLPEGIDPSRWDLKVDLLQEEANLNVTAFELSSLLGHLTASGSMPLGIDFSDGRNPFLLDEPFRAAVDGSFSRVDLAGIGAASDLAGLMSGRFSLSGPVTRPEGDIEVRVNDVSWSTFLCDEFSFDCLLDEGRLAISDLIMLQEGRQTARGSATIDLDSPSRDALRLPDETCRFEIALSGEEVDIAQFAGLLEEDVSGTAAFDVRGEGTLGDPRIAVDLDVKRAAFTIADAEAHPVPVDLRAKLLFAAASLEVSELVLTSEEGADLHAEGEIPLGIGWNRLESGTLLSRAGSVSGHVSSNRIELEQLNRLVPGTRRLSGLLTIEGSLAGTLSRPEYEVHVAIENGYLRTESRLPSLTDIELSLRADPAGIRIESLDARMGAGPIHGSGGIAFENFRPASVDITLKGDHVLLARGGGVKARADLDLVLQGPVDSPRLSGEIALVDTRYVKHIPLIPGKGPPSVDDRIRPFELTEPYLANVVLDVTLVTREKGAFRIDNNLLDGEILLDMLLKGKGSDPYFQGTATFNEMRLTFPNSRFEVDAGRLSFTERDPYMPHLELSARGRRQSYDISFAAWGPLNDAVLTFSAVPPLSDEDVLVLVTTGMLPESLEEKGVENEAAKQVGAYLGMELFHKYFGSETTESDESIMDRIDLSIGTEVGRDGTDNVVVEYNIHGPWSIQVERDIYSDTNIGVVYRIRFR